MKKDESSDDEIYRQLQTLDKPEERVRLCFVHYLVTTLNFPKELIVIECALTSIAHLSTQEKLPNRRLDILCYAKGIHPEHSLYPLMICECKAVDLTHISKRQVIGYNQLVQAPYICLVNDRQTLFSWYNKEREDYIFRHDIPCYSKLIKALSLGQAL